jgi:hypothetical protein
MRALDRPPPPSDPQLADDLAHARVGLDALRRVQAGTELQYGHVGARVRDAVDGVREAALLANLVK